MNEGQKVIPKPPKALRKEALFRLLWLASGRRASVDTFFTSLLKHRHYLPVAEAAACIPLFEESEVRLRRCPVGGWSTPLIDVYVIIKAVLGFRSKRILELGSYRGDTARLIAENTPEQVRICTVDVHPDHGASYLNSAVSRRIDRKIGQIASGLFSPGEEYDFIFVDADHDYKSVMNDSMVAFQVLSRHGVIFWHDYSFQSYFHGMGGIPEAMKHFAAQHAIVSVRGTMLAMCSRHPGWETSEVIRELQKHPAKSGGNVWQDSQVRG